MPPKWTAEMAKGFTLYMQSPFSTARADEIVELARSNLRRYAQSFEISILIRGVNIGKIGKGIQPGGRNDFNGCRNEIENRASY